MMQEVFDWSMSERVTRSEGEMGSTGSELQLESSLNRFEERVVETVKRCEQQREPPLLWAVEVMKYVANAGFGLPSAELGQALVSQLCFSNNIPSLWKFLEQALASGLVSALQVQALLASRIIPHRQSQPEAYRLFLELLSRYALSFDSLGGAACHEKVIRSIDCALQLSRTYNIQVLELGHAIVLCFFSIVVGLIDSILEDWGLQMTSVDEASGGVRSGGSWNMDVNFDGSQIYKSSEHREQIRRTNSFMALELLGKLTESRKAVVLLRIVHLILSEFFNGLLERMQLLESHKLASPNLKSANHLLVKLSANIQRVIGFEYQLNKLHLIGKLIDIGSCKPAPCCDSGSGLLACWVPFDIFMENAMDGKQLPVTSAIDTLTETIYTLQVFNRASWRETFLALWLSALRLVQRERDPLEGPVPHLEARLCVLLSIVPLAIAHVLENNVTPCSSLPEGVISGYRETRHKYGFDGKDHASRKWGLISSLQVLGHYSALLCPPASAANAANDAAAKAASFISNSKIVKDRCTGGCQNNTFVKDGGDMRHLIVEACISRKLVDTSAYFWPGYVSASVLSMSDSSPLQTSPWSKFMEGSPLTGPLINALITTPASSFVEVEKLFHIALNGSEEEMSAAARILCGASLSCGWNIQEHVVQFVVKLLSPPLPPNFTGPRSHLIDYLPMLNAILSGASSVDTVHTLSLHGVVPQVAASLLPLCEALGSIVPTSNQKSSTCDEPSIYAVFSAAFLFLLRLWKFYRPPLEQCVTGGEGTIGGGLTLEYLLLLFNSRIQLNSSAVQDEISANTNNSTLNKPIYIDSFPKFRAWYSQNRSCIASTLSGLCNGNPVHQVANKILNMIYWKMTRSGTMSGTFSSTPSSSSLSSSTGSSGEDAYQRPMLPAWEVLEAIPFVLEAILTACAHGRLSSRDLTTGLRDLVDFLPASLATIVSYFSAEVTRGVWKPVPMNGIDWPSPAANLSLVESEIKEILAAAGVKVPSCSSGASPAMLPLPMAALASLTITFKLDKSLQYIHAVAGLALENCASGCPWPSMPIVGSLWAKKCPRWHDFIVMSCSRSVFKQNREAVAQLLQSCFASFLGSQSLSIPPLASQSGVNGLLGNFVSAPGFFPRVAPGLLYLRSCRAIHNVQYVTDEIVGLVARSACELSARWVSMESPRLKSTRASLAVAISRAKDAATLGASLLCVAGGLQLVQELYQETIPTWLLSAREEKRHEMSAVCRIVEGYSMAYLVVLSGALIWGVGAKSLLWPFFRRSHVVGVHMNFIAEVLDGNISLGCDPATWKAYVSCLVGLVVSFTPTWVQEIKQETLRKLVSGLRGWHECELAISLLERSGAAAIGSLAELINTI